MSTETKKTQIRDKSRDAPGFGRGGGGGGNKLARSASTKSLKTNPPSQNNNNGSIGEMRIKKALQKSTKESSQDDSKEKDNNEDDKVPGHLREFLASIAISKGQSVREARKKKQQKESGNSNCSESNQGSSSDSEEEILMSAPKVDDSLDKSSKDELKKETYSKEKSLSQTDYTKIKENTKFTEYEIHSLWSQFKDNFPSGRLNRQQLSQLLSQIFRRKTDNALVVENIMRLFDTDGSGFISFRELIVAFSMSMKGSIEEKLHWAFKLYDQDNSNEIDEDEMVEIFQRLCRIATGGVQSRELESPSEEKKKNLPPQIVKPKSKSKKKQVIDDVQILSSKLNERIETRKRRSIHGHSETSTPTPGSPIITRVKNKKKDVYVPFHDKKKEEEIQRLLKERERNCELFDAKQRAIEIFQSLDTDGNGIVTEEEFIRGCMTDESFIVLLNSFNGTGIWC